MAKNPARKWTSHAEWCYERYGIPIKALSRKLKTGSKTITAWDKGTRPIPHWAPQVLRLHRVEGAAYLRQLRRPDPRNETTATTALAKLTPAANDSKLEVLNVEA